jgi:hypothetical protein
LVVCLGGCVIPELTEIGKHCPCDPSLRCNDLTQLCVAPEDVPDLATLDLATPIDLSAADLLPSCGPVTYADATPTPAPMLTCDIQNAAVADGMSAGLTTLGTAMQVQGKMVGGCISMTFATDRMVTNVNLVMTIGQSVCGVANCGTNCGNPMVTIWRIPPTGNYVVLGTMPPPSINGTVQSLPVNNVAHGILVCRQGIQTTMGDILLDYLGADCT